MNKKTEYYYESDAKKFILEGINIATKLIEPTLGVQGRKIIIDKEFVKPEISDDGVNILNQINLDDPKQQLGVKILQEVAQQTNDKAGDGPQPLWSKIYTPEGYTTMKDISVGDKILGTNNSIQEVLGVFEKGDREIYKVVFSDKCEVECSLEHIWSVITDFGSKKNITTKDLLDGGLIDKKNDGTKKHKYFTPIDVAYFKTKDLPIDPYTLGVLLGDGSLSMSDQTEISLGLNKEHIIEKLVFPSGITTSIKYDDNRNYFRVKVVGKTEDNRSIQDILSDLGLQGTYSNTKFIPNKYLFGDIRQREAVLAGLTDTDGYINVRGLLEYSTVSDKLSENIRDLFRGLGKETHYHLHDRKNDTDSYSATPIHRIKELKGYKYGKKIIDIRKTNESTSMRCIKVSNEDNLYFTDNYVLTHNTTTATVLANSLVNNIIAESGDDDQLMFEKDVGNTLQLKKELNEGIAKVIEYLDKNKKEITTKEQIKDIGRVSANSEEIGSIIADVFDKLGKDASVTVGESKSLETTYEIIEGMEYNQGFISPYMMTDAERQEAVLEEPKILVTDFKLRTVQDVVCVSKLFETGLRSLVIIADDIDDMFLKSLIVNRMRGISVLATKAPGFGKSKDYLEDIATLTGATFISKDTDKFEDIGIDKLGNADKIVSTQNKTVIIGGKGKKKDIKSRVAMIRNQIKKEDSEYEIEKLEERISKLGSGVGVIKVGGATEIEVIEKKAKIEDAINAVKGALEEGIVAGGGIALLRASKLLSDNEGEEILKEAILRPFEQIIANADLNVNNIKDKVLSSKQINYGYDVENKKFGDMIKMGIVDPVKVTKTSLTNAMSIALLVLSTSGALVLKPEDDEEDKGE